MLFFFLHRITIIAFTSLQLELQDEHREPFEKGRAEKWTPTQVEVLMR